MLIEERNERGLFGVGWEGDLLSHKDGAEARNGCLAGIEPFFEMGWEGVHGCVVLIESFGRIEFSVRDEWRDDEGVVFVIVVVVLMEMKERKTKMEIFFGLHVSYGRRGSMTKKCVVVGAASLTRQALIETTGAEQEQRTSTLVPCFL